MASHEARWFLAAYRLLSAPRYATPGPAFTFYGLAFRALFFGCVPDTESYVVRGNTCVCVCVITKTGC